MIVEVDSEAEMVGTLELVSTVDGLAGPEPGVAAV